MKKLNILHVSDLHFEDREKQPAGNIKDKRLSSEFQEELRYKNVGETLKKTVLNAFRNKKIDLIACTGDLCKAPERKNIDRALKYLVEIADNLNLKPEDVFVIPGNHDIDRENNDSPLEEFVSACKNNKVSHSQYNKPLIKKIKGIPIICVNSCIGSNESHKEIFREEHLEKVADLLSVLEDKKITPKQIRTGEKLDIPAIGISQFGIIQDVIRDNPGNCSIVLSHHSPLPTQDIEVRPYGCLLDSGMIFHDLTNYGKKIILLHGHKHKSTASAAHSLDFTGKQGMLLVNGVSNFDNNSIEIANIEVTLKDVGDFLCCNIYRYEITGLSHRPLKTCSYFDNSGELVTTDIDLSVFDQIFYLCDIKEQHPEKSIKQIAEELLKIRSSNFISIKNQEKDIDNWVIERNLKITANKGE